MKIAMFLNMFYAFLYFIFVLKQVPLLTHLHYYLEFYLSLPNARIVNKMIIAAKYYLIGLKKNKCQERSNE
jgi:hypothetical protein